MIDGRSFQKPMPLAKILAELEKQLPKDKKVSLRIHGEAFGKNLAALAKTPVVLPPFPKRMTLWTALRMIMGQIYRESDEVVDYRIFPTHFAITTRKHSAYTAVHDIRDHIREVLPKLKMMGQSFRDVGQPVDWSKIKAGKESDYLARLLLDIITTDPVPVIEIRNGTRLAIHTNHLNHSDVSVLLDALRSLADLAVVMNARLLEVDRAFFDKHLAPLFANSKGKPWHLLARADAKLVKMLDKQKVILQGEKLQIPPGQLAVFLSLHSVTRYLARPEIDEQDPGHGTIHSGVSFSVKGAVSDDRRRVELKITQAVSELVEIKKIKGLDVRSGKEVEIESPNVRKSLFSATRVIEDGQALVMPVAYRTAVAKKQDRLWVLLAEPMIYIEEEQEQIRLGYLIPRRIPKDQEKEVPKKKPPAPARSEKVEQILHALVQDLLTSPNFQMERDFMNRPGKGKFRLEDGSNIGWPDWFQPTMPGFTRVFQELTDPDNLELNPGYTVVIRLEKFDLMQKDIIVNFHHPAFMRGLWVYFAPKREGKRWSVDYEGSHSP